MARRAEPPRSEGSGGGRLLALLALLALAALATALLFGGAPVEPAAVLSALVGDGGTVERTVVLELRLPRALTAFGVGGLLALAGALLQALLRNPLADPYVLGLSGGAAAGALGAGLLGLGAAAVPGAAAAGALGTAFLVLGLAGGTTPARLLLTGVVVASGWGAVVALLLALGPDSTLQGTLLWLLGDLSGANSPLPALTALTAGLLLALPLARPLDLLARGELQARSLGLPVASVRFLLHLGASLLTAAAVWLAGPVGFVGLVVPHLLRLAGARGHRLLLPAAALAGGTLLTVADTAARSLLAPRELPVGALTALLGVPAFLHLLRRTRPWAP